MQKQKTRLLRRAQSLHKEAEGFALDSLALYSELGLENYVLRCNQFLKGPWPCKDAGKQWDMASPRPKSVD
ncbi:hypothetical protein M407DRAFT_23606 [Tulasnella calospora MUT 4182]|uniref:Uncharacterized protein n=1 Tax=Tulasnella calospora MUT 4182 TaxID=1051891 RepID=A0A0C3QKZ7_9AGAM|nr:hypothetical protein M407DRAFT_23606 [Tulasnella calospora MUT 4182]